MSNYYKILNPSQMIINRSNHYCYNYNNGNSHFGSITRCFNNCVKDKYKSGRITKLYNDENCIYIDYVRGRDICG